MVNITEKFLGCSALKFPILYSRHIFSRLMWPHLASTDYLRSRIGLRYYANMRENRKKSFNGNYTEPPKISNFNIYCQKITWPFYCFRFIPLVFINITFFLIFIAFYDLKCVFYHIIVKESGKEKVI